MSNQISPQLAFEVLARILSRAAEAEVSVTVAKKEEPEVNTALPAGC